MRLIDADTLKEAIKSDIYVVDYGDEGAIYGMFWSGIEYEIDEQPTVEKKTGKWVQHTEYREWDVCSVCGMGCKRREYGVQDGHEWILEESYPFCPNCGSRMLEEGGEDDG